MEDNINIPMDVPSQSINEYLNNYEEITLGSGRLMLFAGDTGGDEGLPTGLSENGHVAFGGVYSDAIYVSTAVAVPEPGTLLLALPVLLGWGLRQRLLTRRRRGGV